MSIKNKIIKWLGGYTQDELIEKKTIEFCRVEKPISVVQARFAIDAQHGKPNSDTLEAIKHNLCYQAADFMFKYNLLYYDFYYDEVSNCYIMRAKAYVREP
jgi:hypothetical protein